MSPNGIHRQSSLRDKLKHSICCFAGTIHHDALEHGELYYNKLHISGLPRTPTTPISPSGSSGTWFKKSTSTTPTQSEFGGDPPRVRGRSLRSRMGRRHHHRQSQSADFSYDPSSYALNFENESPEEEFPVRNFSSRLPASPPTPTSSKFSEELTLTPVPKEIVGFSWYLSHTIFVFKKKTKNGFWFMGPSGSPVLLFMWILYLLLCTRLLILEGF